VTLARKEGAGIFLAVAGMAVDSLPPPLYSLLFSLNSLFVGNIGAGGPLIAVPGAQLYLFEKYRGMAGSVCGPTAV
jgi:hypothetical protein